MHRGDNNAAQSEAATNKQTKKKHTKRTCKRHTHTHTQRDKMEQFGDGVCIDMDTMKGTNTHTEK